jgi:hypothetical protein
MHTVHSAPQRPLSIRSDAKLTAVEVPVSIAWMLHLSPPPDRSGKIADVTVSGLDSPTAGDGKSVCLLSLVGLALLGKPLRRPWRGQGWRHRVATPWRPNAVWCEEGPWTLSPAA